MTCLSSPARLNHTAHRNALHRSRLSKYIKFTKLILMCIHNVSDKYDEFRNESSFLSDTPVFTPRLFHAKPIKIYILRVKIQWMLTDILAKRPFDKGERKRKK